MSGLIRFFAILAVSLLLHACGGGDAETPWDTTTTTDGTGTDTTTGDGTTDPDTGTGGNPLAPAAMQFVSADPANIGIKGFGLAEVSKIVFKLVDVNGLAIEGQRVDFQLSTNAGGISLAPMLGITDVNGLVNTDVTSGTVNTVATVRATLASDPTIWTRSDTLIVSTGIADQNSMSVSVEVHNPEAWNYDGVKVGITVHAADHFNNPVPDGTAVSFTTEGGQIQSGCFTADGGCTVNWTSSNPRPSDGRVTILASMIGEESFLDANGNGVLDGDDPDPLDPLDLVFGGNDMPEAFSDYNEDGVLQLGSEEFLDYNNNGVYDPPDGYFNGVLCCDSDSILEAIANGGACKDVINPYPYCEDPSLTSPPKNIHVRGWAHLVMSGSFANISYSFVTDNPVGDPADPAYELLCDPDPLDTGTDVDPDPDTLCVNGGEGTLVFTVTDVNGQTMPVGTTIDLEVTNGELKSRESYTVSSTTSVPTGYQVRIAPTPTADDVGELQITVTTPKGNESYSSAITIRD